MDIKPTNARLYRASLERATASPEYFFNRFYLHFIGSGIEIARMFHGRSMERIKHKLQTTLELVTDNVNNVPGTNMYLELLGRIHEKRHVTPQHIAMWKTAMLDTVADCDPDFDESIRAAWHKVLDALTDKLHDNIEDIITKYPSYQQATPAYNSRTERAFARHS